MTAGFSSFKTVKATYYDSVEALISKAQAKYGPFVPGFHDRGLVKSRRKVDGFSDSELEDVNLFSCVPIMERDLLAGILAIWNHAGPLGVSAARLINTAGSRT